MHLIVVCPIMIPLYHGTYKLPIYNIVTHRISGVCPMQINVGRNKIQTLENNYHKY